MPETRKPWSYKQRAAQMRRLLPKLDLFGNAYKNHRKRL
jgi:hypothetical protein